VDDRVIGAFILVASIAGIGVYFWLLFLAPSAWAWLTIQISAMAAIGVILLIMAWIGYTLATTPPPTPLEDLDIDLDDFDMDEELGEDDSTSGEKAESSTEENPEAEA